MLHGIDCIHPVTRISAQMMDGWMDEYSEPNHLIKYSAVLNVSYFHSKCPSILQRGCKNDLLSILICLGFSSSQFNDSFTYKIAFFKVSLWNTVNGKWICTYRTQHTNQAEIMSIVMKCKLSLVHSLVGSHSTSLIHWRELVSMPMMSIKAVPTSQLD